MPPRRVVWQAGVTMTFTLGSHDSISNDMSCLVNGDVASDDDVAGDGQMRMRKGA